MNAATLGADMVFIDLEDSVAPEGKEQARDTAVRIINAADWGDAILGVRINAWNSPWGQEDLAYVVGNANARLDVIIVPKVEELDQLSDFERDLSDTEWRAGRTDRIGIEIQIESAKGLVISEELCAASIRLESVIHGPGDMAASLQVPTLSGALGGEHLPYVLGRILVAGRLNGLQVINGPYFRIDDLDGLRAEAERDARMGLDGKWVVHPSQIPIVHDAFTPSEQDFEEAVTMLEAFRSGGGGAVRYGDQMVDEASAKLAEKLVARGERAGLHSP